MNRYILKNTLNRIPVTFKKEPLDAETGLSNRILSKNGNVFHYTAKFGDGSELSFIGKRKAAGIIANGIRFLSGKDILLFSKLTFSHKVFGYNKSWMREAAVYKKISGDIKNYMPEIYGSYENPFTRSSFIALKKLDNINKPTSKDIYRIIDIMADVHRRYYNDEESAQNLCLNSYTSEDYRKTKKILKKLFNNMPAENAEIFGAEKTEVINRFIDDIDHEYEKTAFHRTLTHNDLADRNISVNGDKTYIYDWELACFQNPEHDVIELISSIMDNMSHDDIEDVLDYYKEKLAVELSYEMYRHILVFNLLEYCVNKLTILRVMDKKLGLGYAYKLAKNTSALFDILKIY